MDEGNNVRTNDCGNCGGELRTVGQSEGLKLEMCLSCSTLWRRDASGSKTVIGKPETRYMVVLTGEELQELHSGERIWTAELSRRAVPLDRLGHTHAWVTRSGETVCSECGATL